MHRIYNNAEATENRVYDATYLHHNPKVIAYIGRNIFADSLGAAEQSKASKIRRYRPKSRASCKQAPESLDRITEALLRPARKPQDQCH